MQYDSDVFQHSWLMNVSPHHLTHKILVLEKQNETYDVFMSNEGKTKILRYPEIKLTD